MFVLQLVGFLGACGPKDEEILDTSPVTTDGPDADTDTDADSDADVDADTDSDSDTDSDTDSDSDTDPVDTGPFDFKLTGSAYDGHEGKDVHMQLYITTDPVNPVFGGDGVVTGGAWEMQKPNLLEGGASYVAYWYVDADGDGVCQPGDPAGDHMWSDAFPTVDKDLVFNHAHDTNFDVNACNHL